MMLGNYVVGQLLVFPVGTIAQSNGLICPARVLAGLVASHDIMDMGAGGLLAEIPSRPLPREGK